MTAAHVIRDPIDDQYSSISEIGDRAFRFDKSLHMGVLLPSNPAMKAAPPQVFNGPDEFRDVADPLISRESRMSYVKAPLNFEKAAGSAAQS